jgi:hypothetical protein
MEIIIPSGCEAYTSFYNERHETYWDGSYHAVLTTNAGNPLTFLVLSQYRNDLAFRKS